MSITELRQRIVNVMIRNSGLNRTMHISSIRDSSEGVNIYSLKFRVYV